MRAKPVTYDVERSAAPSVKDQPEALGAEVPEQAFLGHFRVRFLTNYCPSPEFFSEHFNIHGFGAPWVLGAQKAYGNRASQTILARSLRRKSDKSAEPLTARAPFGIGRMIDAETRKPFEAHFQSDLSDVRIHTDTEAANSADELNAQAYTLDRNIYFSPGAYAPSTTDGKRLLAHELTHVVQQQRESVPDSVLMRKPVPQQQMPDWHEPFTFTVVKTSKLDASGPYTGYLLHFISTSWTKAMGDARIAQSVVDALESSDYFVRIAGELDAFYRKRPHPGFAFSFSQVGTAFSPAGTPIQYAKNEPVWLNFDLDLIGLDYSRSGIDGPAAHQIASFVSAVIHESTHALDYIKKITEGGLAGNLAEEQRTRKAEIKGLEQIKAGTKDSDMATEIDARIEKVKAAGLTRKEIAGDLISAGDFTYLESFYVSSAVGEFLNGESKARDKLDPDNSEIAQYIKQISVYDDLNYSLLLAAAEYAVVMNAPLAGEKAGKKQFAVSPANKTLFLRILKTPMTLRELTAIGRPAMTTEEQLLFFHILLVKAYHIKSQIQETWAAFASAKPGSANLGAVAEKNARELLGRPKDYSLVKN